jgi:preprotein translocase subunit SecF
VKAEDVSDDQVSAAWGGQVTRQAVIGLVIFLILVMAYLVIRFEWRMAAAAVSSLLLDLILTAGVYSLVGFEVTPSTVIGFLTILGYSLYDVVVVFDKVQENTRGITAGSTRTYSEATNLAVNQTIMRSINTGLVALLPVGGLLFIGAGLLGAGTLKDLGLVLFVGMGFGVISSIMFAAPVLTALKDRSRRSRRTPPGCWPAARRLKLGRRRPARRAPAPAERDRVGRGAGAGRSTAPAAGRRPDGQAQHQPRRAPGGRQPAERRRQAPLRVSTDERRPRRGGGPFSACR